MPDKTLKTISASQMSVLFGVNPYCTRWMLYRHFKHGDDIQGPEHNRMDWGTLMEPLLLDAAARDLKFEVRTNRLPDGSQRYVTNGLMGCSRDGDIICPDRGPGAIEIKCAFDYEVLMTKWGGGKTPPRHNEIQLQAQMKVGDGKTPFKWGVMGLWCAADMTYFERAPIAELWEAMDVETKRFFDDVEAGREPNPVGEAVELPLIRKLYPTNVTKIIDWRDDPTKVKLSEAASLANYSRDQRLSHEKVEKEAKGKFEALMLDAGKLLLPHGVVVEAKQSERKGYTVKPTTTKTVTLYVPEDAQMTESFGETAAPAKTGVDILV